MRVPLSSPCYKAVTLSRASDSLPRAEEHEVKAAAQKVVRTPNRSPGFLCEIPDHNADSLEVTNARQPSKNMWFT